MSDRRDPISTLQAWLDAVDRSADLSSATPWTAAAHLAHLAQSVEMSMTGFLTARSPWFQATIGATVFAVFSWRGEMRHDLAAAIPGAPELPTDADWRREASRLRSAIARFREWDSPLAPHFG